MPVARKATHERDPKAAQRQRTAVGVPNKQKAETEEDIETGEDKRDTKRKQETEALMELLSIS
jgi:hypothetical protein